MDDPLRLALLVVTGVAAGLVSTIVSLASLVSYPVLLAMGLPPVSANVTNTVSLVFTGLGAVTGSRAELAGQRRRIWTVGPLAACCGAAGALLLLSTPPGDFSRAVPVLIAGASVTIAVQPVIAARARRAGRRPSSWWWLGVIGSAVYIGYFGAAGGVLLLASLGGLLADDLIRLNALKNALSIFANGVASIGFALFGPVHWAVVAPLGVGFLLGGRVGPAVARRLPVRTLRWLIAGSGIAVAAVLAVRTYR